MIPIYNAIIEDNGCGVDKISLVKSPAVESNFLAFADNKKQVMFSANEEKQIITGVLLRCDYPIYRNDNELGEYYIKFDRETIRTIAEQILNDNSQNKINIEHTPYLIDGVNMFELFIKDSYFGISPNGFENITDGSLFATFKVHNPKVWEAIKAGDFMGFSIEGFFNLEKTEEYAPQDELDEVLELIEQIINQTNNNR